MPALARLEIEARNGEEVALDDRAVAVRTLRALGRSFNKQFVKRSVHRSVGKRILDQRKGSNDEFDTNPRSTVAGLVVVFVATALRGSWYGNRGWLGVAALFLRGGSP